MIRRAALIAAVSIAAVTVTGSIAPTTASAASPGSVTVSEGRRVIRAADHQRCLTLKETRALVHGSGVLVGKDSASRYQTWKGKGKASFLDVVYVHGCAIGAWLDYDNGRQLSWHDMSSPYFDGDK